MLDVSHCISHLFFFFTFNYDFFLFIFVISLTKTFLTLEGMSDSVTVLVQIAGNNNKSPASDFHSVHFHSYSVGSHKQSTSKLSWPLDSTAAIIVKPNFAIWGKSIIHFKRPLEILT